MRIAWFSPLPPERSGIAAYSADLVPRLGKTHGIETFSSATAHQFLWKARRKPYDLVVYQLGNAPCHDAMWGYLAAFPGLVVLHDARLHHARGRDLLHQERFDDYRREFWYNHPDARGDFAEYAVAGLGGSIYYFWPMHGVVMHTARLVAVHNPRVAADLREAYPGVPVEAIRLGTSVPLTDPAGRAQVRDALGIPQDAMVFAAFGKITAEKRVAAIVRAFDALARERDDVHLVLAGDSAEYSALTRDIAASPHASRVHVTGYVADAAIGDYLAAADACLCLRWPTALESSASWLQCLAAGKATVISDLAHLVDIPTIDPRRGPSSHPSVEAVALRIDLLDEDAALQLAMRALAGDAGLRERLARAGHAYWSANHTIDAMAADYLRLIDVAAARPAPDARDLPPHFAGDHSTLARTITERFGVELDEVLGGGNRR